MVHFLCCFKVVMCTQRLLSLEMVNLPNYLFLQLITTEFATTINSRFASVTNDS